MSRRIPPSPPPPGCRALGPSSFPHHARRRRRCRCRVRGRGRPPGVWLDRASARQHAQEGRRLPSRARHRPHPGAIRLRRRGRLVQPPRRTTDAQSDSAAYRRMRVRRGSGSRATWRPHFVVQGSHLPHPSWRDPFAPLAIARKHDESDNDSCACCGGRESVARVGTRHGVAVHVHSPRGRPIAQTAGTGRRSSTSTLSTENPPSRSRSASSFPRSGARPGAEWRASQKR